MTVETSKGDPKPTALPSHGWRRRRVRHERKPDAHLATADGEAVGLGLRKSYGSTKHVRDLLSNKVTRMSTHARVLSQSHSGRVRQRSPLKPSMTNSRSPSLRS